MVVQWAVSGGGASGAGGMGGAGESCGAVEAAAAVAAVGAGGAGVAFRSGLGCAARDSVGAQGDGRVPTSVTDWCLLARVFGLLVDWNLFGLCDIVTSSRFSRYRHF